MKKFTSSWLAVLAALASSSALAQITLPSAGAARPPGLYVQVLDGLIHVTNPSGSSNFSTGQFGFTASISTPPAPIPRNPVMQFTPPPQFNQTGPKAGTTGGAKATVDCEVR